jgi:hypothetical protein
MHNRFALDDELLHAVLARGLHDRRMAVRPIVSAAQDQACFWMPVTRIVSSASSLFWSPFDRDVSSQDCAQLKCQ